MTNQLMRIITTLSLLSLSFSALGSVRVESCQRPEGETHVTQNDFHWNMELSEIMAKESEIRASGARLKGRAFVNESGQVVMPLSRSKTYVALPQNFISSVTKHVEKAFDRGYINALIFPDMGHSHLYIDKKFYEQELSKLGSARFDELYQKVFEHKETKILYHTAEQLRLTGDDKLPRSERQIQWRFYTRNLLGDLHNTGALDLLHEETSSHNTAHNYKPQDYRYWGAGFNISTSKDGCFSYQVGDHTFYFDLSFEDLPY